VPTNSSFTRSFRAQDHTRDCDQVPADNSYVEYVDDPPQPAHSHGDRRRREFADENATKAAGFARAIARRPALGSLRPKNLCNFVRAAAYCFDGRQDEQGERTATPRGAEAAMGRLRFKLAAALARPSNLASMTNKDVGLKCGQRVSLYPPAIRPRKVAPDRFCSFS